MGNQASCGLVQGAQWPPSDDGHGDGGGRSVVKLVHCNGMVDEFYRGVRVGELTVDYPQHFVVHSGDVGSLVSGDAAPMAEDAFMEPGQLYLLLHRRLLEGQFTRHDAAALVAKAARARKHARKHPRQPRPLLRKLRTSISSRRANRARIAPHDPPLPMQPRDGPPSDSSPPHADYIRKLLQESRRLVDSRSLIAPVPPAPRTFPRSFSSASPPSSWRPALETIHELVLLSSASTSIA